MGARQNNGESTKCSVICYEPYETRTLKDMTRDAILQDTHRNILEASNNDDMRPNDDEGDAHSINRVMSPRIKVCVPRQVMMPHLKLDDPSIESTNRKSRSSCILIRKDPNTVDILDSGDQVCIGSQGVLCLSLDDLSNHEVPTQTSRTHYGRQSRATH